MQIEIGENLLMALAMFFFGCLIAYGWYLIVKTPSVKRKYEAPKSDAPLWKSRTTYEPTSSQTTKDST